MNDIDDTKPLLAAIEDAACDLDGLESGALLKRAADVIRAKEKMMTPPAKKVTETPITDAAEYEIWPSALGAIKVVKSEVARELERQNVKLHDALTKCALLARCHCETPNAGDWHHIITFVNEGGAL